MERSAKTLNFDLSKPYTLISADRLTHALSHKKFRLPQDGKVHERVLAALRSGKELPGDWLSPAARFLHLPELSNEMREEAARLVERLLVKSERPPLTFETFERIWKSIADAKTRSDLSHHSFGASFENSPDELTHQRDLSFHSASKTLVYSAISELQGAEKDRLTSFIGMQLETVDQELLRILVGVIIPLTDQRPLRHHSLFASVCKRFCSETTPLSADLLQHTVTCLAKHGADKGHAVPVLEKLLSLIERKSLLFQYPTIYSAALAATVKVLLQAQSEAEDNFRMGNSAVPQLPKKAIRKVEATYKDWSNGKADEAEVHMSTVFSTLASYSLGSRLASLCPSPIRKQVFNALDYLREPSRLPKVAKAVFAYGFVAIGAIFGPSLFSGTPFSTSPIPLLLGLSSALAVASLFRVADRNDSLACASTILREWSSHLFRDFPN